MDLVVLKELMVWNIVIKQSEWEAIEDNTNHSITLNNLKIKKK